MKNTIEINGFNNSYICALEATGLAKCLEAYAENCAGSPIMEIGFNPNTGYTYIALEMEPITICSQFGQSVQYLFTDFDNGKEYFCDNYADAVKLDNSITL